MEIQELLNTKSIMTMMLAAGGVGSIIGIFKSLPNKIWNLLEHKVVHSVTLYDHDKIYKYFEKWFYENHKNKFKNVQINHSSYEISRYSKKEEITFSQKDGYFFIKYNGSILYIKKGKIDRSNSAQHNPYMDYYVIRGISKKSINILVDFIQSTVIKSEKVSVYAVNTYGEWIPKHEIKTKKFKDVILPQQIKNKLTDDIDEFLLSENWYLERGIPYNRGFMFEGEPGNGKTSLAISIADKYNKLVFCLDLSTLQGDGALMEAFRMASSNSIILMEDIDAAFLKRENETKGITFSCLLNCLDGAFQKHGLIVIMTTNHIENLDPALIRDGRIDFTINIPNPDKVAVEQYISHFYSEPILLDSYSQNISMATVQGICIKNKKDMKTAIETFNR